MTHQTCIAGSSGEGCGSHPMALRVAVLELICMQLSEFLGVRGLARLLALCTAHRSADLGTLWKRCAAWELPQLFAVAPLFDRAYRGELMAAYVLLLDTTLAEDAVVTVNSVVDARRSASCSIPPNERSW